MRLTLSPRIFYPLGTNFARAVFRLLARWTVTGREHAPRRGPLIIASNHLSLADPPLIGASIPRRVTFMAKTELFERGFTGFLVRSYGAFPVRRFEADLAALRRAVELLQAGRALGMFPEGTRSLDHQLHAPHPGVAMLALRTGTPVLPVAVWGTERVRGWRIIFQRPEFHAAIGEPLDLGPARRARAEEVSAASERIMRAIAALLPPRYRGLYAEMSEEMPRGSVKPG